MYSNAYSVVHYKNWMTPHIYILWGSGVHQGCPLSCHLFNLVGQVLIYSLQKVGFFMWWKYSANPCSLYVDDTAIFLLDLSQLHQMINHIQWVGTFTGLNLNLNKTIAFYPKNKMNKTYHHGVCASGTPVKYLGAYLSSSDLSSMNFEAALKKARNVSSWWGKRNLTLPVRVVVLKTFIFSIFVHILNSVHINQCQVDTIQKLLLDFLWQGRACLKMSMITVPPSQGGLKMLHVKNVPHSLRVKWMQCLSIPLGLSWSRFIWPKLSALYPPELYGGMREVHESDMHTLPPFYARMVRSFCQVNNLFYEKNPTLHLSHNLWATIGTPAVHMV